MYNGKSENKQAILDHMCQSIMEMSANGSEDTNHIIALKFFHRDAPETTWCGSFDKGDYVRVVWSDDPTRSDGYYDVFVEGDSGKGLFEDVWNFVKENIG